MSEAFEILCDALDEAISDAKEPKLTRELVTQETVTKEFVVKVVKEDESKAG